MLGIKTRPKRHISPTFLGAFVRPSNMRSNRYLRALISAATQKDTNEAIVEVVGRHRMRGDNLEHVAVRLGIADIVSVALSFDGGIFDIEGRLIIRLNSLASPDRQHFT